MLTKTIGFSAEMLLPAIYYWKSTVKNVVKTLIAYVEQTYSLIQNLYVGNIYVDMNIVQTCLLILYYAVLNRASAWYSNCNCCKIID